MAASDTVKQVGGLASGIASMVPGYGTAIGAGISGATALVSGILQQSEAKKQAAQAEKIRQEALNKKTAPMREEFKQKLRMDKALALGDMAGIGLAKDMQEQQLANSVRAIKESSPSGAATVNAISAALGQKNREANRLAIENSAYKQDALKTVSNDLAYLGEKGVELEDKRDQWKREGLQAAAAFENAATANNMNAINTITGAISSTAGAIGKNADNRKYMQQLADIYGDSGANALPTAGEQTTTDPTNTTTATGGGSFMNPTQTVSFAPDQQQRVAGLLSGSQELTDADVPFLTNLYNSLAVSGKREDAMLASQIQQLLQANR